MVLKQVCQQIQIAHVTILFMILWAHMNTSLNFIIKLKILFLIECSNRSLQSAWLSNLE